jgi:hypothetical protein
MIDIEGAEVNKNHRLAFIEDGVAFCQDCVSHLLYSLDNSSGESFVNP